MKKQDMEDATLDALLNLYRVPVDSGEAAVIAMVRAARLSAARLKEDATEHGFLGLVASALGFRRKSQAMWSGLAAMAVALLFGVTLGVSDVFPSFDEKTFALDLDSVIGGAALSGGGAEDLSL